MSTPKSNQWCTTQDRSGWESDAFFHEQPTHVSDRSKLSEALVMYDNQFHKRDDMFPNLVKLYPKIFTVCANLRVRGH